MPCLSQVQHRLLDIELANKFECQSPLLRNIARLPSEVIEHIILFILLQEKCVLRFFAGGNFCPDANLTPLQARLSRIYDLRRVDVYTKGPGGYGTYEVLDSAPHIPGLFRTVPNNVIVRWSPGVRDLLMYFPRHFAQATRTARIGMTYFYDNNKVNSISMNDPFWDQNQVPDSPRFIDPKAVQDLPFTPGLFGSHNDEARRPRHGPGSAERFASMRHLVLANRAGHADPLNIRFMDFGASRTAPPGTATTRKQKFQARVLREQSAWLDLDWEAMRLLRTLFVDLSWVPRVGEEVVREGAARMCEHLELELLVIHGLRSSQARWLGGDSVAERNLGRFSGRERPEFTVEQVEGDDVFSIAGEEHTNWIKMFKGALAVGGRLMLLDDRLDGVNWTALEAQALVEKRITGDEDRASGGAK